MSKAHQTSIFVVSVQRAEECRVIEGLLWDYCALVLAMGAVKPGFHTTPLSPLTHTTPLGISRNDNLDSIDFLRNILSEPRLRRRRHRRSPI